MNYLLVVDDSDEVRTVVARLLQAGGYEVAQACDGPLALQSVAEREPSLIILDLWMPGMSGLEVCATLKANPFTARVPVLMLTAQSDIDHKIRGFEAGADDYLAKPFEPRELLARVQALLRLVSRESDRNPSSGLPGGRAIETELARRAATQEANSEAGDTASNEAFAVIYFDLDHFKPFADTFGFAIADKVIRATGPVLRHALEKFGTAADFAGHIGGDDFIAVTSPQAAENVARVAHEEFRAAVAGIIGDEIVERGTFSGRDRDGTRRDFAVAQLSSIIMIVEPGSWRSPQHLGERAAELKRSAKATGAGVLVRENL